MGVTRSTSVDMHCILFTAIFLSQCKLFTKDCDVFYNIGTSIEHCNNSPVFSLLLALSTTYLASARSPSHVETNIITSSKPGMPKFL
jgi:hypothetical protein